jgi:quercetin dioxygenase-like cupin family protein
MVMTAPRRIDFGAPVSHDPGVEDAEAEVQGTRWALVTYAPGKGREDWCDTPHSGYVLEGELTYAFEDGREELVLRPGDAFALPTHPRHRGRNTTTAPARLFIIDALA